MSIARRATIIDEDAEHVRAAYWRRRIMLLKPEQLSELIGYSWRQIYQMETGTAQIVTPKRRKPYVRRDKSGAQPIDSDVWLRYKMACAALHAQRHGWTKGRAFEWRL